MDSVSSIGHGTDDFFDSKKKLLKGYGGKPKSRGPSNICRTCACLLAFRFQESWPDVLLICGEFLPKVLHGQTNSQGLSSSHLLERE